MITVHAAPLADPGKILAERLVPALTEATMLLEREIKQRTPVGVTEAARGSITSEVRTGVGIPVATVGSPLKHVAVLNDGRRPGQKPPPAEALELWVRRNVKIDRVHASGMKAGQVKTRKGKTLSRAPTSKEALSIAFVIARAIGARGTPARRMFEETLQESEPALQRIFGDVGLRITMDITEKS
jgi:hypothetical protein